MNSRCAVVIASCDAYADVWPPFFRRFHTFWSECPYPVFLLSNHQSLQDRRVMPILAGDIAAWSDSLRFALEGLEYDVVFLVIDDLLLTEAVDTRIVEQYVSLFADQSVNYVRLAGRPRPRTLDVSHRVVGTISPRTVYRTATVMSLWRRTCLLRLLASGETAWQFETAGSDRSDAEPGFYAVPQDVIRYENAIIKGRWRPSVLSALGDDDAVRPLSREVMTTREERLLVIRSYFNAALYALPVDGQRKIRGWFRR